MPTARTPIKPATPESVKALMIVEALVIGVLSSWVYSEYLYNVYFRIYVDSILLQHITTYTAVIGLSIGLAGSVATLSLWKSLRQARFKLETVTPRMRGSMDRILSNLSPIDEQATTPSVKPAIPPRVAPQPSPATIQTSQTLEQERKK